MINIKDLIFRYPNSYFELNIPQLRIDNREHCCIIGASGSGKTTIINIMAGILKPVSGSVCVNNIEINRKHDKEIRHFRIRHIGYIFQNFALIDYLNVEDNILFPYYIGYGLNITDRVRDRLIFILERLQISNLRKRHPEYLSQGEKQRVSIARALIINPKIIIGDEPTGNLDINTTKIIMNLIMDMAKEFQATLIFVTHNVLLAEKFDRVIDMNQLNKPIKGLS